MIYIVNKTTVNMSIPILADMTFTCVPRGIEKLTWGAIVSIVLFSLIGFAVITGTAVEYRESQIS